MSDSSQPTPTPEQQALPPGQTVEELKTTTQILPLSIVEFSPFSVLIFNRAILKPGATEPTNEIMLSIKRYARDADDDPGSIPVTAVPTLIMMLEEIVKPAMEIRSLVKPPEVPKE